MNNKLFPDEKNLINLENLEYFNNNFLQLSLKNSLIKGLSQKIFCLKNENFESNIILGKNFFLFKGINFPTNNIQFFKDEQIVLNNHINNPDYFDDSYNLNEFKTYDKFMGFKANKISGFSYEK